MGDTVMVYNTKPTGAIQLPVPRGLSEAAKLARQRALHIQARGWTSVDADYWAQLARRPVVAAMIRQGILRVSAGGTTSRRVIKEEQARGAEISHSIERQDPAHRDHRPPRKADLIDGLQPDPEALRAIEPRVHQVPASAPDHAEAEDSNKKRRGKR